ncbi:hypothetical protein LCGC14_2110920 [marine sediment metagenome]|uniref:DUF2281 domain-containing protein n=1 Tax=marine sediment metagenome TaxID=412755 RepID=A0A0F9E763_9ZZZZ
MGEGIIMRTLNKKVILKRLDELPPELTQEVLDFIEFLRIKKAKKEMSEQNLLLIQQESLRKIWDSEGEDLYEV